METSAPFHHVWQSVAENPGVGITFVVTVTVPAGSQKQVPKTVFGSCRFEPVFPSYLSNRKTPGFEQEDPLNRISQLQAVFVPITRKLSLHVTLIPVEAYLFVMENVLPAKTPLSVASLL